MATGDEPELNGDDNDEIGDESIRAQDDVRGRTYVGRRPGRNFLEAFAAATEDAWRQAKRDGKDDTWLYVESTWVKGSNPIDWCMVVLKDPSV